jgi:hypothetical protein
MFSRRGVTFFKKVNTLELLKELQNRKFSEANRKC